MAFSGAAPAHTYLPAVRLLGASTVVVLPPLRAAHVGGPTLPPPAAGYLHPPYYAHCPWPLPPQPPPFSAAAAAAAGAATHSSPALPTVKSLTTTMTAVASSASSSPSGPVVDGDGPPPVVAATGMSSSSERWRTGPSTTAGGSGRTAMSRRHKKTEAKQRRKDRIGAEIAAAAGIPVGNSSLLSSPAHVHKEPRDDHTRRREMGAPFRLTDSQVASFVHQGGVMEQYGTVQPTGRHYYRLIVRGADGTLLYVWRDELSDDITIRAKASHAIGSRIGYYLHPQASSVDGSRWAFRARCLVRPRAVQRYDRTTAISVVVLDGSHRTVAFPPPSIATTPPAPPPPPLTCLTPTSLPRPLAAHGAPPTVDPVYAPAAAPIAGPSFLMSAVVSSTSTAAAAGSCGAPVIRPRGSSCRDDPSTVASTTSPSCSSSVTARSVPDSSLCLAVDAIAAPSVEIVPRARAPRTRLVSRSLASPIHGSSSSPSATTNHGLCTASAGAGAVSSPSGTGEDIASPSSLLSSVAATTGRKRKEAGSAREVPVVARDRLDDDNDDDDDDDERAEGEPPRALRMPRRRGSSTPIVASALTTPTTEKKRRTSVAPLEDRSVIIQPPHGHLVAAAPVFSSARPSPGAAATNRLPVVAEAAAARGLSVALDSDIIELKLLKKEQDLNAREAALDRRQQELEEQQRVLNDKLPHDRRAWDDGMKKARESGAHNVAAVLALESKYAEKLRQALANERAIVARKKRESDRMWESRVDEARNLRQAEVDDLLRDLAEVEERERECEERAARSELLLVRAQAAARSSKARAGGGAALVADGGSGVDALRTEVALQWQTEVDRQLRLPRSAPGGGGETLAERAGRWRSGAVILRNNALAEDEAANEQSQAADAAKEAAIVRGKTANTWRALANRVEKHAAEIAAGQGDNQCGVCLSATPSVSFGCGHVVCSDCLPKLGGTCPFCRTEIAATRRLFL